MEQEQRGRNSSADPCRQVTCLNSWRPYRDCTSTDFATDWDLPTSDYMHSLEFDNVHSSADRLRLIHFLKGVQGLQTVEALNLDSYLTYAGRVYPLWVEGEQHDLRHSPDRMHVASD